MVTVAGHMGGSKNQKQQQAKHKAFQRTAVDWEDEKYATPQPSPDQKFKRQANLSGSTPELDIHKIKVRTVAPAVYYIDGVPLPSDEWTTVPKTPSLMKAIKAGDVEEHNDKKHTNQPHPHAHHTQAQPTSSPVSYPSSDIKS